MKDFYGDEYLLSSPTAQKLYQHVKDLPIFDYHCHLSPADIDEDRCYTDLGTLWLSGDHYKWRAMRQCGVSEDLITGNASPKEKFFAFAACMPRLIGNPVYAWVHLELKTYFGIHTPLSAKTAAQIWEQTAEQMKDGSFSARKLIMRSHVEALCTTDDPCDDLAHHAALQQDASFPVRVLPSFRPDVLLCGLSRPGYSDYVNRMAALCDISHPDFEQMLSCFAARFEYFAAHGCVTTDLSLGGIPSRTASEAQAEEAYRTVLSGGSVSAEQEEAYTDFMLRRLAALCAGKGLVMQLHLSAIRNNRSFLLEQIGADCGIDSVGPFVDISSFSRLLDTIDRESGLPKMIVYTLNPAQYYEIAGMLGNFCGGTPGKLQLGAAWWFCDHVRGIREQLSVASEIGALGCFNGMLTDSRSFTSYPRHDYFRRILCDFLAKEVSEGAFDPDFDSLCVLAEDLCVGNARHYFTAKEKS